MLERTSIVRRAALLAGLAALALPAGAGAAEVTRSSFGGLDVSAAPGEANRMRVSDDGPGFVRIRDEVLLREAIAPCAALSTFEVRCAVTPGAAIVLRQGDRDDRAEIATTVKIGIDAQAGNDTYAGGLAAGRSDVLFRGGTGVDTVSYADAGARVAVRLGNGADDGRAGDRDDAADAETIVGSRFGDDLVGTAAAETFRPGQGDDVVHGDGGADRYESLPTSDGADHIFGTGGADIVSYRDRTKRVNATVDAGGDDDGEAGERDELVGVAGVRSGSGSDTLRLERTVDAELDGGPGADTLVSGGGRDVLVGGPGVDTLSSGAGIDRVAASDPDRDTIDCGGDSPDEAIVSAAGETTTSGCERVLPARTLSNSTRPGSPVGTLRLTPAALDVPAGGVARVRLEWTHPRWLVVRPALGGRRVRVRLSNRFGTGSVTFSSATVARRAAGAGVVAGSLRRLRFGGRSSVTIPAGREVRSDPAALRVRRFGELAVSVNVRGATGPASQHLVALQTWYASIPAPETGLPTSVAARTRSGSARGRG